MSLLFIASAEAGKVQQASSIIHVGLQLPTKTSLPVAANDPVFHKHGRFGNIDRGWLLTVAVQHPDFNFIVERPTTVNRDSSYSTVRIWSGVFWTSRTIPQMSHIDSNTIAMAKMHRHVFRIRSEYNAKGLRSPQPLAGFVPPLLGEALL